jgi:hypothetical protein
METRKTPRILALGLALAPLWGCDGADGDDAGEVVVPADPAAFDPFVSDPRPLSAPVVLADGLSGPGRLTPLRDGLLLVVQPPGEAPRVMRLERDSGEMHVVGKAVAPPHDLAVGAGVVWWTEPEAGVVSVVPLDASAEPLRLDVDGHPEPIAVDGERAVWVTREGRVVTRQLGAGSEQALAQLDGPAVDVLLTEDAAYVAAADGTLWWVSLAVKSAPLADGQHFGTPLRRWGPYLYWVDAEAHSLRRISLGGEGDVESLSGDLGAVSSMALTRHHAWVRDPAAGTIARLSRDGGPVITVLSGLPAPSELVAAEGGWIAWINRTDGAVMALGE